MRPPSFNTIPPVSDWFRSIGALGAAFTGVVAMTLVLAALIVSAPTVVPQPSDAAGPIPEASEPAIAVAGIPGLGGELIVTGDLEGTFPMHRRADGPRFGLTGPDGRVFFDGTPISVVQLNVGGLSFFPDAGDCTVTAGNLTNAIGIGRAELRCDRLDDIRGNGTVAVSGTVGLPLDLLAVRELPLPGGSATVGAETWTFDDAVLEAWQMPIVAGTRSYNLELVDEAMASALNITFDLETRRLTLASVSRADVESKLTGEACDLRTVELGQLNPRTTVIELSIHCRAVEMPELGVVSVDGTVIVERLEWPE
jgi:hypothetical protein